MHSRSRFGSTPAAIVWVCALAYAGCTTKETEQEQSSESICPSCKATAGGESGDFSGTPSVCPLLLADAPVGEAEAIALGYEPSELRRLLGRAIELPLAWREPGVFAEPPVRFDLSRFELEPPSGYALEETRISLHIHIADTLIHVRPDPGLCDGVTCTVEVEPGRVVEVPKTGCDSRLALDLTVDIETADGAVRGTVTGRAEKVGSRELVVRASADLASVPGKLRLSPKTEFGQPTGVFWLVLDIADGAIDGVLSPEIFFWNESGNDAQVYTPILGVFPAEQPREPAGAGRARPQESSDAARPSGEDI